MWQPSWACPTEGYFFPPTLFTNVSPATTIAQVEIFGPVLVSMTFRTPAEAVALANNTRYGLAASVWSDNINLALDVAPKLKAGSCLDQLHQLVRCLERLWRLSRKRLWARRWQRGPVRICAPDMGNSNAASTSSMNSQCLCSGLNGSAVSSAEEDEKVLSGTAYGSPMAIMPRFQLSIARPRCLSVASRCGPILAIAAICMIRRASCHRAGR